MKRFITFFNKILKSNKTPFGQLSPGNPEIFDLLNRGDIGIDCGANVGDVSALMAKNGADIYAFEPNPFAFEELKKRFENSTNVICINKGVLDRNGNMPLYLHEFHEEDKVKWSTGSSFLEYKGNIDKNNFFNVEIIDIVEFIENLNKKVKILKIDVEGVEFDILNKLIDTRAFKKIELILVETHEKKIPELREKAEALNEKIKKFKIKNINLNWI